MAVGLTTDTALSQSIQLKFPVVMTADALRIHQVVQTRANACRNSQAIREHASGNNADTGGDLRAVAQATKQQAVQGTLSTVTVGATHSTSLMMEDASNRAELLVDGQEHARATEEAESAEVGHPRCYEC